MLGAMLAHLGAYVGIFWTKKRLTKAMDKHPRAIWSFFSNLHLVETRLCHCMRSGSLHAQWVGGFMLRFQVSTVRGYPPWYGPHHGRQGPHTASCWQQLHEQTWTERSIPRGGGEIMVIVLTLLLVCMYLNVLHILMVCSLCYIVVPTMWGGPPIVRSCTHIYT